MVHEIELNGYLAKYTPEFNDALLFDTWGNYGIHSIHITRDSAWNGMALSASFYNAREQCITVPIDAGGRCDVPPEATAYPTELNTTGKIVIIGEKSGMRLLSTDIEFIVLDHAPIEGSNSITLTPDQYTQFVNQVSAAALRAENAATRVEDILENKGIDPADIEEVVNKYFDKHPIVQIALDTTLSIPNQAAEAKAVGDRFNTVNKQLQELSTPHIEDLIQSSGNYLVLKCGSSSICI